MQKTPNIYPIWQYAEEMGTWSSHPPLAESIWRRRRDRTWYAVECRIDSPERVHVYVRTIADTFSGGIGNIIHEFDETEFTDTERKLIKQAIDDAQFREAAQIYYRREEERVRNDIKKIQEEIFNKS